MLPVTARGLTLLSALFRRTLCSAVVDRTRGEWWMANGGFSYPPSTIPALVRQNPRWGPPLGGTPQRKTSLARCSTHAASPPHRLGRAKRSVSPSASAREVAGLTTPVYRLFSVFRSGLRCLPGPRLTKRQSSKHPTLPGGLISSPAFGGSGRGRKRTDQGISVENRSFLQRSDRPTETDRACLCR